MPQLLIRCTDNEHRDLYELARQMKSSPSVLGQIAIRKLIEDAENDLLPVMADVREEDMGQVMSRSSIGPDFERSWSIPPTTND